MKTITKPCSNCPGTVIHKRASFAYRFPDLCDRCKGKIYGREWRVAQGEKYLIDARMRHKLVAYGLDATTFRALYDSQGGQCPICDRTFPAFEERSKQYSVDHDHETGKVRGLLCQECNKALGFAHDDIDRLKRMISYLLYHYAI